MQLKEKNLLVVLGPTASGKTTLGVKLAERLEAEIISADSRQVYRGLDIGAGKDLDEYLLDGKKINYHLIDVADLDMVYSVFDFQQQFYETFGALTERGIAALMVGGTGLYIEAVLEGYQMVAVPENKQLREELKDADLAELESKLRSHKSDLHNTTDLVSRETLLRAIEIAVFSQGRTPEPAPEIRALVLGTRFERAELVKRIAARLAQRLQNGLVEEVESLRARGVSFERLDSLGLEYRFVADFLQKKISSRDELFEKLAAAIAKFAKRQLSWFRRMERRGIEIHWIEQASFEKAMQVVERYS
jgi:tRNA dimethylallyltransferase